MAAMGVHGDFVCLVVIGLITVACVRSSLVEMQKDDLSPNVDPVTYLGMMKQQSGDTTTLNAVMIGRYWGWSQKQLCSFKNYTYMFGTHQASYARKRSLLYYGVMNGVDQSIMSVTVNSDITQAQCKILPLKLPIAAGEYRLDIFPDQEPKDPKPTIVGALNGSPSKEYFLYELHGEDTEEPSLKKLMTADIKHPVQQIFGSYYDSTTMTEYIGFNEGHLFWNVPPCWILIIDVKNRKVLNATYYEHEAGFDFWFDPTLKSFFIPTSDDCAVNKSGCVQGVRPWTPEAGLGEVQSNFCIKGTACFSFEVGYGYAFNPSNHTAVMYGGVSGWWYYDVTDGANGQYEYSTVFVTSPVYVGKMPSP